jgi:hypothetical protein
MPTVFMNLDQIIRSELHRYRQLIANGKGEWPKTSYIDDVTWMGWLRVEQVLESCLTRAESQNDPTT